MKINLTGFSSAQNSGHNTKNVIGLSNLLKEILEDNGHDVEYGIWGREPDLWIVSVLTFGSLNTVNVINCLELMRDRPEQVIIAFDDWNIKEFYRSVDGVLDGTKLYKTHPHLGGKNIEQYRDVIQKLADGSFPTLFPAYKTGDHDLLQIRGKKWCLDPSIYIHKERPFETEVSTYKYHLLPVHASLAAKWSDLDKKKFTLLNVRGENEDAVFEYYCRHRIVMTPPHYHDGSGWFRNRYSLAILAKAVIIEDYHSVFGPHYAIERKDVTDRTIDYLFQMQAKAYDEVIMSKEEIADVLADLLKV